MSRVHVWRNTPKHWNNNLICVVDIETTGLNVDDHEILEIALIVLNAQYEMEKSIRTFNLGMKLIKPLENIDEKYVKFNRVELSQLINRGIDKGTAADLLEKWFLELGLPDGKKLQPLVHNWSFVRPFLVDWLGPLNFSFIFDDYVRDLVSIAHFCNDREGFNFGIRYPYPKQNLSYIASQLKIENPSPNRALSDAWTIAQCYQGMLRHAY